MKLKYLFLFVVIALWGCDEGQKSEPIRTGIYFDLVELLDQQAELLAKEKPSFTKMLTVNGETETISIELDSASQWKAQLALFYQADINKLGLETAYVTEEFPLGENQKKIIDEAKGQKATVRLIEYNYLNEQLTNIRILSRENNTVYEFDKELNLNFSFDAGMNRISSFSIIGNQDMLLKSDLSYSLKAVIGN
ncbi:MAG: hypothetical protein COW03_04365 [Cytophagales bacterium CG12_big_fil_rev_8_21_14_0_65_40_12]|nr:MAG: hypothetical protein COW03_04365 [Cytophagales bacterium CG12_big_fil_rev_8_21_14_0_65_40_12]PIW05828.1 MAG: hypothetical protein COW40_02770 [Cytophagales bacterium CG17_big_fil_post_rev_8_21_14_2_50_40_13]